MAQSFSYLPNSTVEGLIWPAPLTAHGSALIAMQYQFEQIERLPLEEIQNLQFKQIEHLLQYTQKHVPFYKNRLKSSVFKSFKGITQDQFRSLPLLTREDIQKAGESLLSKKIPSQHGKVFESLTSGSTGKQVKVWQTNITTFFWQAFTLRDHLWHRRNLSNKLGIIRFIENDKGIAPNGLHLKGWGPSTNNVFKTGPSCVLNIKSSINEQANWLLQEQPHYLLTHPSNLLALTRHFQNSSERLQNLKEVRTLSESLTSDIRKACFDTWGVPVTDMYTTKEVGYIALQCPEHEHYHLMCENVLTEILDDDGFPCNPGEIGRVVVTSLNNYASPIIRYDIGDYAEAGEQCPCGRGLPVIKRVMGRVRNMLTLPSGDQSWPILLYSKYRAAAPVKQGQFIQRSLDSIDAYFVTERHLNSNEEEQLKKAVQDTLGHPFQVTLIFIDEIPRTPGGKFEEFISLIN